MSGALTDTSSAVLQAVSGSTPADASSAAVTRKGIEILPGSTIPSGCTYNLASGKIYKAGQKIPSAPKNGDEFFCGDYTYKYGFAGDLQMHRWIKGDTFPDGWGVRVNNPQKSVYDEIITSIAGKDVTNLYCLFDTCPNLVKAPVLPARVIDIRFAFSICENLVSAPEIPATVKNMNSTFYCCDRLETAPSIPDSVTDMGMTFQSCPKLKSVKLPAKVENLCEAFSGCTSLTSVPYIPKTVTDLSGTFKDCKSLAGSIIIDASPLSFSECFSGTIKNIKLGGASDSLDSLIETSEKSNISLS